MKNNSTKIAVLIGTIILGFLITINFNFNEIQPSTQLNAREYQNIIEEKQKLLKQISSLREGNASISSKINNYSYEDKKQDKIVEDMIRQLADYGMLTGLNEVKGPGLVIKLTDGTYNGAEDSYYDSMSKILHDSDMALLFNEIRVAGAEAIAVNNHRVSPLTAVICKAAYLGFEDGDQVNAPFSIYIIGDPDSLEEVLTRDGSHLRRLRTRGLFLEIEKKEEIKMPSANIRNMSFMEEN
ncbi:DUF881 domain-containing protein [Clostridium sp. LP20]|uniref:DUF881 domain-containing protein n=1 Tax=Clostridium sp. LP20 TaxID=3418665 RepID=UPI003EE7F730